MPTETVSTDKWIQISDLTKRFHHQPVLNHLALAVHDGECCLLVGDNGAGKTTLLRIIAGLTRPSQGQVILCGESVPGDPGLRQKIGYVGHQPMFYQDLSASENLHHYARLYRLSNVRPAVLEALDQAKLTRYQHQPVRTLSRGMQQRLSLARATLHRPIILLLDEPYTGLDQEAAQDLDSTLRTFCKPGHAIMIAAHRPQRLLKITSHIAWLREGVIHQHIPVGHIGQTPELQQYLQEVT